VSGTLLLPPVVLCTSCGDGRLPSQPLESLIWLTVLPAALQVVHTRLVAMQEPANAARIVAGRDVWLSAWFPHTANDLLFDRLCEPIIPAPMPSLRWCAACVCVGGEAPNEPSTAARQMMAALARAMPFAAWMVVHVCTGVSEPLLGDEAALLENALVVIVDAVPDTLTMPSVTMPSGQDAASVVRHFPASATGVAALDTVHLVEAEEAASDSVDAVRSDEELAEARAAQASGFLNGGLRRAHRLMRDGPMARALHACHCRGGVVVAIDAACALLDCRWQRAPRVWRPAATPNDGKAAAAPPEADATQPAVLPFLVALPTPPHGCDGDGWYQLRASTAEHGGAALAAVAASGGGDTLAALGLPASCIAVVLPGRKLTVRVVLGSSIPLRLSASYMMQWAESRLARQKQCRFERERLDTLAWLQQREAAGRRRICSPQTRRTLRAVRRMPWLPPCAVGPACAVGVLAMHRVWLPTQWSCCHHGAQRS